MMAKEVFATSAKDKRLGGLGAIRKIKWKKSHNQICDVTYSFRALSDVRSTIMYREIP